MSAKSCFNCQHVHQDRFPQTQFEPEHFEFECGHPNVAMFPVEDDDDCNSDEDLAMRWAINCPGYELDVNDVRMEEPDTEFLTLEDTSKLMQVREVQEQERLISLGLLTPNGEMTNEYLAVAQITYECYRD